MSALLIARSNLLPWARIVQQHAVRDVVVGSINGGPAWGLSIRLGSPAARRVPVRLRREA